MELAGSAVLVTGGARGIGRAIVERLAAEGMRVAASYHRSEAEARELQEALARCGRRVELLPCDLGDPAQAEALVEEAERRVGPLDLLVNNAGIVLPTPVEELSPERIDRMLAVNVRGTLLVTAAAARRMKQRRSGRIVTVSSVAAEAGTVDVLYAATKAALLGMTRALARELGRYGVLVNAVAPGPVETRMNDDIVAYLEQRSFLGHENLDTLLARRKVLPQEVAEAVVFLARHDFMTGQTLHVNGGMWW